MDDLFPSGPARPTGTLPRPAPRTARSAPPLTGVIGAVDDTVTRLTTRGLVDLDAFERQALVKDLTVAFYTRRGGPTPQDQE
ncbi:hypothetical protein ACFXGT_13890 [Streptomyces sp. NPDC059352]|uniref:hypothetical protein n=1 Tax=Streptomyces sp. NPDC059352 TaxID=3346810 RepID=UPI003686C1CA